MHVRLLVIEDDPTDMGRLVHLLDAADLGTYELRATATISEAERYLVNHDFDCVLLDLSLPDSMGLQSLQRTLDYAGETPVLVLTGRDDYELGLHAIGMGAQDFLVKGELKGNTILRCAGWAIARKRAIHHLVVDAPRWRSIDNLAVAVALVDAGFNIFDGNPMFSRLVGRPLEALGRCPIIEVTRVPDANDFYRTLEGVLANETPIVKIPVEMIRPDGAVPCLLVAGRVEPDPGYPPSLLVFVVPGH